MNLKEVVFKYEDKSEYTVRIDNSGDTIMGEQAHKDMYSIQRFFMLRKTTAWQRINFIFRKQF